MSDSNSPRVSIRILRLRLTNFLSYRNATIDFDDLAALVGPNAAGKSNAVAAIKLLREIPFHGLPTAIARRGGFDQLRHRSQGRPYNPSLRLEFQVEDSEEVSHYELRLGALKGKRYEVLHEESLAVTPEVRSRFVNDRGSYSYQERSLAQDEDHESSDGVELEIPAGQSAVVAGGFAFAGYLVARVLQSMQTVEVNPARVGELQEPSSTREFEPDGSNTASVYESLSPSRRRELTDQLSAIVPGISRIDVRRLADKQTLIFFQKGAGGSPV